MTVVNAFRVGIAVATGGDVDAALNALRAKSGPQGAWRHQVPYVRRAEGWAYGAEHFLRAAEEFERLPIFCSQLLYEGFRAGADVRERMAAVVPRADARLVDAYARHVAADSGDELLAVADEFAAIGALRYALEAAVGAADAFQRAGDREWRPPRRGPRPRAPPARPGRPRAGVRRPRR